MLKNRRFGKISITIILTILIWVWADLSQDEERSLSNLVALDLARPSDATLWVSFVGIDGTASSTIVLDNVILKGPASQIAEIDRTRKKGLLDLNLVVIPEDEGLTEVRDTTSFNVLEFLRDSTEIRDLGLTVESCEPAIVPVQVRRLVEKNIAVQCVDENGIALNAQIDPSDVSAYVPSDGVYVATVRLSSREREQARDSEIKKTPYLELIPGQRHDIATEVSVTLSPEQVTLAEYSVPAILGYSFSANLQGKYRVELDPQSLAGLGQVKILATQEARMAFESETFHMFLYILDADLRQNRQVKDREVVFNFPEEFVRRGEIEATVHPRVSFTLVPVTPESPAEPAP